MSELIFRFLCKYPSLPVSSPPPELSGQTEFSQVPGECPHLLSQGEGVGMKGRLYETGGKGVMSKLYFILNMF